MRPSGKAKPPLHFFCEIGFDAQPIFGTLQTLFFSRA
jgi:hypothetical protein